MPVVTHEWWCWCLQGTGPHYHRYLSDDSSIITYPKLPDKKGK